MQITWQDDSGNEVSGQVPAQILPMVEALGIHAAAEFILYFRGRYLCIHEGELQNRNPVVKLYGMEATRALYSQLVKAGYGDGRSYQVPTAKVFLSRYLRSKGLKYNEIANRLGCSAVTVAKCLWSDLRRAAYAQKESEKRLKQAIDEAVALGLVVRVDRAATEAVR